MTMNFVSIDFETATGYMQSACAIGLVIVENDRIIDEYYSLIQPPDNQYWYSNIKVHGITPQRTFQTPTFDKLYQKIHPFLKGKNIVAHNESFDRNVLIKTMGYYGLNYADLNLSERWDCTLQIYRKKGFSPANLSACCSKMSIELDHHNALSDARACAKLYLLK